MKVFYYKRIRSWRGRDLGRPRTAIFKGTHSKTTGERDLGREDIWNDRRPRYMKERDLGHPGTAI